MTKHKILGASLLSGSEHIKPYELRTLLRHLFLSCAGYLSQPAPGVHILNGHLYTRQNGGPATFRKLLTYLQNTCKLIRIEEAVGMVVSGSLADDPCIAFTFDDGFEEQYTGIAPVLEEFGINAAFFVLPGFINGDDDYREQLFKTVFMRDSFLTAQRLPMTWDQVKELSSRGHIIGSHGMHHRPTDNLDDAGLTVELDQSAEAIWNSARVEARWFAFPFGRLSGITQPVIDEAKQRYLYLFSQDDYRHYFSFGQQVINRRHFEPFWPVGHVKYFVGKKKIY